jgi:hypothetical protein
MTDTCNLVIQSKDFYVILDKFGRQRKINGTYLFCINLIHHVVIRNRQLQIVDHVKDVLIYDFDIIVDSKTHICTFPSFDLHEHAFPKFRPIINKQQLCVKKIMVQYYDSNVFEFRMFLYDVSDCTKIFKSDVTENLFNEINIHITNDIYLQTNGSKTFLVYPHRYERHTIIEQSTMLGSNTVRTIQWCKKTIIIFTLYEHTLAKLKKNEYGLFDCDVITLPKKRLGDFYLGCTDKHINYYDSNEQTIVSLNTDTLKSSKVIIPCKRDSRISLQLRLAIDVKQTTKTKAEITVKELNKKFSVKTCRKYICNRQTGYSGRLNDVSIIPLLPKEYKLMYKQLIQVLSLHLDLWNYIFNYL